MKLRESVEAQVKIRFDWLHQAERAVRKIGDLPETITELEGSGDCGPIGGLKLHLYGGDKAMQVCIDAGAEFSKPEIAPWSGNFRVIGHLGDTSIDISDLSVPPQCRVEKEEYTAYRYKAICDETGEEPKPGAC